MKLLRKLVRLPADERRLLVRTVIVMSAFRLGLWLLPFRWVAALTGRRGRRLPEAGAYLPERIAWAVQVASRYVPKATCLIQALTAKVLLENAGFPASLHVGVAIGEQERFEAHAWVETDGRVISGGSELERYSLLLLWEK